MFNFQSLWVKFLILFLNFYYQYMSSQKNNQE